MTATPRPDGYKWVALANTTLASLLATIDTSIVIVAMPKIFRALRLDPLDPANSFYLLWMILGFLVVCSALMVSFGRLGDMFGRVRMYNVGFAVYTVSSLLLALDWMHGRAGADYLIAWRLVQGVGAAFLLANSAAILTDAFPSSQRGLALGINTIIGLSGQFLGLVLGGLLAAVNWRLIFLVSVPPGIAGTVWSLVKLREIGVHRRARLDLAGNATFAVGLVLVMVGVTYGVRPYGSHPLGWLSPLVLALMAGGAGFLLAFAVVETRVAAPMFQLPLFRIRAFSSGITATFFSALARGGLMFILIVWLQGVWLPLHGYSFTASPLWAGIFMLPLTGGWLVVAPLAGVLTDRHGTRFYATAGMAGCAAGLTLLITLPVDFSYPWFGSILFLIGVSMGLFTAPNRTGVMNSLPEAHRGAGGGMNQTVQYAGQVLSIGVFFTLIVVGLAATLPHALAQGLVAGGVPPTAAQHASHVAPVSVLFAAFLGYNPVKALVGAGALHHMSAGTQHAIAQRSFFPRLLAGPFHTGLHAAILFAIAACVIAAAASALRGGKYVHEPGREPVSSAESRVT